MLCCVATIKSLPVQNHSAGHIFSGRLGSLNHSESFENKILLKPVLGTWLVSHNSSRGMSRLNYTEFDSFVSLVFASLSMDLRIPNLLHYPFSEIFI